MVHQKCLEENQDTLTVDRVTEIATDIYNSDCQRSIMQTLSSSSSHSHTTRVNSSSQSYKKITEKMENQKGDTEKMLLLKTKME